MPLAGYNNSETQIAVTTNQVSTSTDVDETYTVIVQEENQGVPQPTHSAGMAHSYTNLSELRPPWVPAPARASKSRSKSENAAAGSAQEQDFLETLVPVFVSSSSSVGSLKMEYKPVITPSTSVTKGKYTSQSTAVVHKHKRDHRNVRKSSSKLKAVKHDGRRRVETGGYRLQSKDSLVDVTACLQAKREEVMKIWEKNLFKDDPGLISQLEKANRLALEAAEEVESLRRVIQDFQNDEEGLTNQDCQKLEHMRTKVLGKVQEFEKADRDLQATIDQRSSTKATQNASKTSQTETDKIFPISYNELMPRAKPQPQVMDKIQRHRPLRKSKSTHSWNDFVILKKKADNYSEESVSDYGGVTENHQRPMTSKPLGTSVLTSLEELSRLNLMYEEKLTFPPINYVSNSNLASKSQSKLSHESVTQVQSKRTTSFSNQHQQSDSDSEETIAEKRLYREKMSLLQKSLLDTEQEVEELKSELERVESDANFRVRLLQNTVEDKFDSLNVIPEYLHILDSKLHDSMETKCQLEEDLREKDDRLHDAREQNRYLKKECEEMREKLRSIETSKDLLSDKNAELEKSNQRLRKEIEDVTKQMENMIKIANDKETSGSSGLQQSKEKLEISKLKMKCLEYKDQLAHYKRMAKLLKKSKANQKLAYHGRFQEMIVLLEECQEHKRVLGQQIRELKTSYYECFPSSRHRHRKSRHSHKSKSGKTHAETVEEDEDAAQNSTALKTGKQIHGKDIPEEKDDDDGNLYKHYRRPTVVCFADEVNYSTYPIDSPR